MRDCTTSCTDRPDQRRGCVTSSGVGTTSLWGAWSAQAMMLPYMEQQAVYNALNFAWETQNNNPGTNMNITGISAKINSFICPSSITIPSGQQYTSTTAPFNTYTLPGNNYFMATGSSMMWRCDNGATYTPPGGSAQPCYPNGLFCVGGKGYNIADITDGTANTIAAGEFRTGDYNDFQLSIQDFVGNQNYSDWGATTRDLIVPTANMPLGGSDVMTALNQCAQSWTTMSGGFGVNGQRSWNGRSWAMGLYSYTLGNLIVPPNSSYPYCEFWSTNGDWDAGGFMGLTSFHPGGANVMMADGSVRFIKSSIAWNTLWGLGSRAQSEVISADSY